MRAKGTALGVLALVTLACGPMPVEVEAAVENTDAVEIVVDLEVEFREADGQVVRRTLMDGVVVAPGSRDGGTFEVARGTKLSFRSSVVREGTTWEMPAIETPARGGLFLLRFASLVGGGFGYETADWVDAPGAR